MSSHLFFDLYFSPLVYPLFSCLFSVNSRYFHKNGVYSHTSGLNTITKNSTEFACGAYNKSDEGYTLFSVGAGFLSDAGDDNNDYYYGGGNSYVEHRKNAFEIRRDYKHNEYLNPHTVEDNSTHSAYVDNKRLATEVWVASYIDDTVVEFDPDGKYDNMHVGEADYATNSGTANKATTATNIESNPIVNIANGIISITVGNKTSAPATLPSASAEVNDLRSQIDGLNERIAYLESIIKRITNASIA
jgi:hypothetical protein